MAGSLSAAALLTGAAAVVVAGLAVGLARAGRRAGRVRPWAVPARVAAGLVAWLGTTVALAETGVLADWAARPPRWPLLPLTALAAFALLSRAPAVRRLLAHVPPWQPIALQTFRVAVELAFWRLHAAGAAPVQVTFEGRNFDAIVGLTAPVVAAGVAAGRVGPRAAAAWNLVGLAVLFNAIATVATSAPGPLHLDWPGEPFAAVAAWPVVWVPALLAPVAIVLHLASLRQSLTRSGTAAPGSSAPP